MYNVQYYALLLSASVACQLRALSNSPDLLIMVFLGFAAMTLLVIIARWFEQVQKVMFHACSLLLLIRKSILVAIFLVISYCFLQLSIYYAWYRQTWFGPNSSQFCGHARFAMRACAGAYRSRQGIGREDDNIWTIVLILIFCIALFVLLLLMRRPRANDASENATTPPTTSPPSGAEQSSPASNQGTHSHCLRRLEEITALVTLLVTEQQKNGGCAQPKPYNHAHCVRQLHDLTNGQEPLLARLAALERQNDQIRRDLGAMSDPQSARNAPQQATRPPTTRSRDTKTPDVEVSRRRQRKPLSTPEGMPGSYPSPVAGENEGTSRTIEDTSTSAQKTSTSATSNMPLAPTRLNPSPSKPLTTMIPSRFPVPKWLTADGWDHNPASAPVPATSAKEAGKSTFDLDIATPGPGERSGGYETGRPQAQPAPTVATAAPVIDHIAQQIFTRGSEIETHSAQRDASLEQPATTTPPVTSPPSLPQPQPISTSDFIDADPDSDLRLGEATPVPLTHKSASRRFLLPQTTSSGENRVQAPFAIPAPQPISAPIGEPIPAPAPEPAGHSKGLLDATKEHEENDQQGPTEANQQGNSKAAPQEIRSILPFAGSNTYYINTSAPSTEDTGDAGRPAKGFKLKKNYRRPEKSNRSSQYGERLIMRAVPSSFRASGSAVANTLAAPLAPDQPEKLQTSASQVLVVGSEERSEGQQQSAVLPVGVTIESRPDGQHLIVPQQVSGAATQEEQTEGTHPNTTEGGAQVVASAQDIAPARSAAGTDTGVRAHPSLSGPDPATANDDAMDVDDSPVRGPVVNSNGVVMSYQERAVSARNEANKNDDVEMNDSTGAENPSPGSKSGQERAADGISAPDLEDTIMGGSDEASSRSSVAKGKKVAPPTEGEARAFQRGDELPPYRIDWWTNYNDSPTLANDELAGPNATLPADQPDSRVGQVTSQLGGLQLNPPLKSVWTSWATPQQSFTTHSNGNSKPTPEILQPVTTTEVSMPDAANAENEEPDQSRLATPAQVSPAMPDQLRSSQAPEVTMPNAANTENEEADQSRLAIPPVLFATSDQQRRGASEITPIHITTPEIPRVESQPRAATPAVLTPRQGQSATRPMPPSPSDAEVAKVFSDLSSQRQGQRFTSKPTQKKDGDLLYASKGKDAKFSLLSEWAEDLGDLIFDKAVLDNPSTEVMKILNSLALWTGMARNTSRLELEEFRQALNQHENSADGVAELINVPHYDLGSTLKRLMNHYEGTSNTVGPGIYSLCRQIAPLLDLLTDPKQKFKHFAEMYEARISASLESDFPVSEDVADIMHHLWLLASAHNNGSTFMDFMHNTEEGQMLELVMGNLAVALGHNGYQARAELGEGHARRIRIVLSHFDDLAILYRDENLLQVTFNKADIAGGTPPAEAERAIAGPSGTAPRRRAQAQALAQTPDPLAFEELDRLGAEIAMESSKEDEPSFHHLTTATNVTPSNSAQRRSMRPANTNRTTDPESSTWTPESEDNRSYDSSLLFAKPLSDSPPVRLQAKTGAELAALSLTAPASSITAVQRPRRRVPAKKVPPPSTLLATRDAAVRLLNYVKRIAVEFGRLDPAEIGRGLHQVETPKVTRVAEQLASVLSLWDKQPEDMEKILAQEPWFFRDVEAWSRILVGVLVDSNEFDWLREEVDRVMERVRAFRQEVRDTEAAAELQRTLNDDEAMEM